MKIKNTHYVWLLTMMLLMGGLMVNAQPGEVWNISPTWNTGKDYRGIAYNANTNQLYVAGTTGGAANTADANVVQILDASTGAELNKIDLSALTVAENGYGINDVEVSMDGGIFATMTTTNTFNPFKIYYWASEDTDPVVLYQNSDDEDFGPGFSVYGDYTDEALIIVPIYDIASVIYFEVVNGVLGDPTTLALTGVTAGIDLHVQALGTKISDGFWYSNSTQSPAKIDGTGNVVGTIDGSLFWGATGDVKQFSFGSSTYLAVSNLGAFHTIDITGASADFSDVTRTNFIDSIPGTAPVAPGWPPEYGDGQEQAAIGNPDGSYAIFSFSGAAYIKSVATEGAPTANNVQVEGLTKVGEVMTASYVYVDINGDVEDASEIKWFISDDDAGTNKTEITAAAGSLTYTILAEDENKYISFSVLPVAATGTVSDALHLVETGYFGPVLTDAAAPVANDVTITGTIAVNETLTGSYTYFDENGDAEGESVIKWYTADDAVGTNMVEVATGTLTYLVKPEDDAKFILFSVTPVAETGVLLTGETVTVASATAVTFPEFAPEASDLTITGREEVDGELTGTYTYSDLNGDEEGATILKWYRADDAAGTNMVEVADGVSTYIAVAEDEGKFIIFEVTPVTVGDDVGDPVMTATGMIAAKPAPEAPVASDVMVHGTPEVGAVLYGSYTYSDRTDDPEGVSVHKWYTADDAGGTNKVEITSATGSYVLVVTEDVIGKHLVYEITPVATVGELLEGEPVEAVTVEAAVASTNEGDFERTWMRAVKVDALAEYVGTGNTERGFAVGTDHIYIASRFGGTKLVVADKLNGAFVSEMSTTGLDVGLFRISDVEVSADGQILACPLQLDASTAPFVVYKWENELAEPTKFIEFTSADAMRLGDKFTVVGDVSGDALIFAAQSAGNKVVRWVVTGGIVDAGTVITLQNVTSIGSTPSAYPITNSPDANFIVDGRGAQPQIFNKDGNYVGALEGIGQNNNQSNSPQVFYYKNRTLVAFHQKNDAGLWNIIVQDITGSTHITVGTSEELSSANQELGGVHVQADEEFFHLYMLSANNGIARFKGLLELPGYTYSETNETGDKLNIWFSKTMSEDGFDGTGWSVNIGETVADVDTIYRDTEDPTILILELTATVSAGDAVTVVYDGSGSVVSFDGMPLNAFGPEDVVNIVGVSAPEALDVAITGVERAGETLTASYTYNDADGDLEGTSEYQWWYATDAEGSDKLKILGETSLEYVVGNDMEAKFIAFEVIPVALTGGLDYLVGTAAMSDFVRIIPVGIDKDNFNNIRAYPNPVMDILTIDNMGSIESVSVIDITGKLIKTVNTHQQIRVNLEMGDLSSGLYYLRLNDDSGSSKVLKIVKVQ
ncbi:MAG: T9SS type A sorting domain-containing protein [Bacteroidales bacterium]